tara:strand:+ start:127 stop:579 length:453 start_codon:yes stop_codon:yes gene_type:complete
MAVIDTSKTNKPFVIDRDETIHIGLDMPFRVGYTGEGWGASTQTTLIAVKNNLKNLVSTEKGERIMQPTLGVALRKFLFEPFTPDVVDGVKNAINESTNYWLPFIQLNNIDVRMSNEQGADFVSVMEVFIDFSLKADPRTHESIQITIGE